MDLYDNKTYMCDVKSVKSCLDEYGVAIIPSVLNEDECENMKDGVWDYLHQLTCGTEHEISRDEIDSWKNFKMLYPKHSMLMQHFQIGQAQFLWDVRQNPKVVEPFSTIWNVKPEDLLVSFDGASLHLPPEKTNKGWYRYKTWYHTDQSYQRNSFECVQGMVNAYDTNPGDATFAFYEKSHKYHKEFQEKFKIKEKGDWYKLNEDEEHFYRKVCKEKRVSCPKGSLVLWDSRTIHCGIEASRKREKENYRLVGYVCYKPRSMSTDKDLKKKQKAFEEMRTTSHWPDKVKLFPKHPRTYGEPLPVFNDIKKPEITDLGRRLVGY